MLTGSPLKPSGDLIQVIGLLVVGCFRGLLGLLVGLAGGSFGWSSCKNNREQQAWLLLGNIGTLWRNNNLIELSQFIFFLSYKSFSSHQSKLENKQTILRFSTDLRAEWSTAVIRDQVQDHDVATPALFYAIKNQRL